MQNVRRIDGSVVATVAEAIQGELVLSILWKRADEGLEELVKVDSS